MTYSLSNQIGQSKGNDVKNMKCYIRLVQATLTAGMQLPYMRTPQSQVSDPCVELGTYLPWRTGGREGGRGKRCTQHVFSQNKLCLTHYTHIFMQKQIISECP